MKITQPGNNRTAVKFRYGDGSAPRYRVFPADRERTEDNVPRNTLRQEIAFDDVHHAAEFLVRHEGSSIRMDPGGVIIRTGICIERDVDEPEGVTEYLLDAEPGEE